MSRKRAPRNLEDKTDEQILILALGVHRPNNSLKRSAKTRTRLQEEFDRRRFGITISDEQSRRAILEKISEIRSRSSLGFFRALDSIGRQMTKP